MFVFCFYRRARLKTLDYASHMPEVVSHPAPEFIGLPSPDVANLFRKMD